MKLIESRAVPSDVDELVLRHEDSQEVSEGWRDKVKGVVANHDVRAFRDPSGALAGLFGVTNPAPGEWSPWLLCSDVAGLYPKDVMRITRQWMRDLRWVADHLGSVSNFIPKTSVRNRAFVEHLGFRIVPLEGPMDLFFLPSSDV